MKSVSVLLAAALAASGFAQEAESPGIPTVSVADQSVVPGTTIDVKISGGQGPYDLVIRGGDPSDLGTYPETRVSVPAGSTSASIPVPAVVTDKNLAVAITDSTGYTNFSVQLAVNGEISAKSEPNDDDNEDDDTPSDPESNPESTTTQSVSATETTFSTSTTDTSTTSTAPDTATTTESSATTTATSTSTTSDSPERSSSPEDDDDEDDDDDETPTAAAYYNTVSIGFVIAVAAFALAAN